MTGSAWQILRDLEAWQITQIPRRPHARQDSAAGQDQADLGVSQRLQALVSAFHYGGPVAFGWIREHPGGPVRVLAAGPAVRGGTDVGQAVLSFPPGARAEPFPPGQAAALLARMPCWMPLAGITDALLAGHGDPRSPASDVRPSLEDGLLSVWSGPFAWLLPAEPLTNGQLSELADQVALAQLGAQCSDSPRSQLAAQRLSARHAKLLQAAATGLWKVRFVAGGPAPPAPAQVAGLLCASADLEGLPYALTPVAGCARLEEVLGDYSAAGQAVSAIAVGGRRPAARAVARQGPPDAPGPLPQARARADPDISAPASPFYASSRLVAALARPPAREVPGIRFVLRPDFDVTPETGVSSGAGWARGITESDPAVPVGTVLDWNRVPAGELAVPRASLNRHTFVCGATGAGKSQTVRGLLEAATRAGNPVAGGRARQGRIPADGRPAARHRGHPYPAGGAQRSAGRGQPSRARARPRWHAVPAANPCRPGSGLVPGRVRGRRAVSPGPGGGSDSVL